jgi:hypothetical protein
MTEDAACFAMCVPSRAGALELEVQLSPTPTMSTLLRTTFRLHVRTRSGELLGEAERTAGGAYRWTRHVLGPVSSTGVAMIETRVNSALDALVRCTVVLAQRQRAIAFSRALPRVW